MDRWQRIEQLFLAASELPPSDRAEFVDREAAGDPELHAAVNGMLRHSGDGGSRFLHAIEQTAAVAAAAIDAEPTHIDRYAIVRELGRGGMGTVYLAERSDGEFQQRVAIKVVTRGLDTAQVVERFRHERRILASLDHPNIARLFDGGATDNGAPYLVMEYIEGRPLVDHCREQDLAIRARLLLFAQICAAVQHAHQKLIVHRDIKPANILVTSAGIPKLLDFGIAKLVSPDDGTGTAAEPLTRVGIRMLTPDYASPEQIRGEPVSVATDVFSLGAVLYELLTGQRAHQFEAYTEAEFYRVICDTEVRPISEAVEDGRLRRQLSGDLDNIVAQALRKDPARRYVSVEQFSSDVQRYLEGRPVAARPETLFYRTRKFVSRNRIPVAAAVLVAVSLAAGIVGTTMQARRADAQAARAERRFQEVRKLANTFVFDIYDGMTEIPGTAQVRGRVVTTALEYLDSLAREAEGDAALQAELAGAYKRIGDVQGNPSLSGFGEVEASLASYDKALAILRRLADRPDADPKVLTDLGTFERNTASVRLNAGDASGAVEHLRRSIAVWERRNPTRGMDIQVDTGLAQAWGIMGQALMALGQSSEAVRSHSAAVGLLRGWLPRQTLPTTRGTLSIFLTDLGDAQRDVGDLRGAIESYREAVDIRKPMVERDPTALNYRRRLHTLNSHLADVFGNPFVLNLGDPVVAEMHAAETLSAAERMVKEDRGSDRSLQDHVWANWTMGSVLLSTKPRRALPYLEVAREIAAKSSENGDAFHLESEAHVEEALGHALLATGNRQRGLELLRKAAGTFERISNQWPQKIDYRFALIRALNGLGDALPVPESAEFYRKAYRAAESIPANAGNVRDLMNQAEANLRWPRWNASAPAAERQRKLEIAMRALQTLLSCAPDNRSVQNSLTELRQSVAGLSRRE
jgi:tetratricopeptide (TPR) repeat protein/tRNA A-37 threonylcarbamoyl transferase component Bud32